MKLSYPILSDTTRSLITSWDVMHPTEGIARPSLFLVNKRGDIVWKYVGADASDRPAIPVILKEIQSAK